MGQLKIKDNNDQWVAIPTGGVGVPDGGIAGQVLTKSSGTDYATEWTTKQQLIPDYSNVLYSAPGGSFSYTATQPCYFLGVVMASDSSYAIKVNDVTVSVKNNTGSVYTDVAAGFLDVGDVLSCAGGGATVWGLRGINI